LYQAYLRVQATHVVCSGALLAMVGRSLAKRRWRSVGVVRQRDAIGRRITFF
jgi:hypothetical protein